MAGFDSQKYKIMPEAQNSPLNNCPTIDSQLAEIEDELASHPADASLLIKKGELLWQAGKHGEAMSAYEAAADIDPEGPAKLLLEHSNDIMDFFNPDLLNP